MTDIVIAPEDARKRLLTKDQYVSCAVAFIDCKKPGSHLKQNYSMIGPGVTTSSEQVVNLREPHGFNIGAAAMPPGITNNLHIHFTAEVFLVFDGNYTFRWGPNGDDGELNGSAGDILSLPTWIFRGFTNLGPGEGWLFTALGGDDTGGIIWHPGIIEEAAQYGLYLTKDNMLVDTSKGQAKPADADLIQLMPRDEIAKLRHYSVDEMARRVVTKSERDWSSAALLDSGLPGHRSAMAPVIGYGMSQDRDHEAKILNPHGFSIEWLRLPPGQSVSRHRLREKQVMMVYSGAAAITLNAPGDEVELQASARDMISVPAGAWRSIANASDRDCEIVLVTTGDGRKTPEWAPDVVAAARAMGRGVDRSGLLVRAELLPNYAIGKL
jgi:quercetin dioxygenase-like cupin family protein